MKIDVEGSELLVMQGARHLLSNPESAPVLLFEHAGHGMHFGITPAQVRAVLGEVGYRIHLLDGRLTSWDSDEQPPTPNVIACRDIDAVRGAARLPWRRAGDIACPGRRGVPLPTCQVLARAAVSP